MEDGEEKDKKLKGAYNEYQRVMKNYCDMMFYYQYDFRDFENPL